jgi:hypothetical protein
MSTSHELTPPPLSSLAALSHNPPEATEVKSEATEAKPEAAEAKPKSHRAHERTDASRMDYCDAAPTTKPQQAQVLDSDQHSKDNSINDDSIHNDNDTTDNGDTKRSARDNGLSIYSANGDFGDCDFVFDPGGDKLNDKHEGISSHGHDDNTAASNHPNSSNSPLSDLVAHSISFNIVFDPGGSPLDNNGVDSEHNAISNADPGSCNINSNLVFDPGGNSFNSSNFSGNSFVYDPGGTGFSNTLDDGAATTTSDHHEHVFDPGGNHFHSSSDLTSSRVPHSSADCNLVFDPGGNPFNSSNSSHVTSTNQSRDRSTTPFDNKATELDGEGATSPHCPIALSRRHFQLFFLDNAAPSPCPEDRIQEAAATANTTKHRHPGLTQEGQILNPLGDVRRVPVVASETTTARPGTMPENPICDCDWPLPS